VTGLSDGDGSLYIVLRKDPTCRFGFNITSPSTTGHGFHSIKSPLTLNTKGITSIEVKYTSAYLVRNYSTLPTYKSISVEKENFYE